MPNNIHKNGDFLLKMHTFDMDNWNTTLHKKYLTTLSMQVFSMINQEALLKNKSMLPMQVFSMIKQEALLKNKSTLSMQVFSMIKQEALLQKQVYASDASFFDD